MDGVNDAVVWGDTSVTVFLNDGEDFIQSFHIEGIQSQPSGNYHELYLVDTNQDERLDIVMVHNTFIEVGFGNGDGTFLVSDIRTNVDGWITSSSINDINGDSSPDLVLGDKTNFSVHVLFGLGDGFFDPDATYPVPMGKPMMLASGDFTENGMSDIIVFCYQDGMYFMKNRGDGTFDDAEFLYNCWIPLDIITADLNNDQHLDTVFCSTDAHLTVLLGKGDGTFDDIHYDDWHNIQSLFLFDSDGDGNRDLFLLGDRPQTATATFAYALGNGDGTFDFRYYHELTYNYLLSLVVDDYNKDGNPDTLFAVNSTFGLGYFKGDSNCEFPFVFEFAGYDSYNPSSIPFLSETVCGDFNEDGIVDIAVTDKNHELKIYIGSETGDYQAQTGYYNTGYYYEYLDSGDFNEDSHLDLVIINDQVIILFGDGCGNFSERAVTNFSDSLNEDFSVIDINQDGHLDIIIGGVSYYYNIGVLLGKGDGTFHDATFYDIETDNYIILTGDINGDQYIDVIAISGDGTSEYSGGSFTVLLGNGQGSLEEDQYVHFPVYPRSATLGDYNQDGNQDVIISTIDYYGELKIVCYLGDNSGKLSGPNIISTEFEVDNLHSMTWYDLNNDTYEDFIIAHGEITIFFNSPNGLQSPITYGGAPASSVLVYDLNNDAIPDILTSNSRLGIYYGASQ